MSSGERTVLQRGQDFRLEIRVPEIVEGDRGLRLARNVVDPAKAGVRRPLRFCFRSQSTQHERAVNVPHGAVRVENVFTVAQHPVLSFPY